MDLDKFENFVGDGEGFLEKSAVDDPIINQPRQKKLNEPMTKVSAVSIKFNMPAPSEVEKIQDDHIANQ